MPHTSTPLVGRDAELAALSDLLGAAAAGAPGMVVVGGDAGLGKTRFVREVAAGARADGWTVLAGACVELTEGAAVLAPVAGVLRQLARDRGDDAVAALLGGPARWLAPLLPELEVELADAEDAATLQVLVSFHRLLRDLADEAPVLLVLEDLHWADATTRDLLRHLASRLYDERLLVLATVRTDDLDRRHPLRPVLAELVRLPAVDRIDLGPLDGDALTAHLAAIAAADEDPAGLATIAERAGGNPFFAEELLTVGGRGLPPSLEDVLLLRLERLPIDSQQLLGEAAVLGADVDAALLERVTSLDLPRVGPAVRAALDDGVLTVDGDRYAFRHALLREVALDRLLPSERVRAHAAAATALEADPDLAVVGRAGAHGQAAHHWWEARDLPRCLAASVAATEEAMDVLATAVALSHAMRAIELWHRVDDPEQLTGTTYLALLHTANMAAFDSLDDRAGQTAREMARAAEEAGDPDARVRATLALSADATLRGDPRTGLELAAEELARHGDERTVARSLAIMNHVGAQEIVGTTQLVEWDPAACAAELDEAVTIARECDDSYAETLGLLRLADLSVLLPDRFEQSLTELMEVVERAGDGRLRHQAHDLATERAFYCGDLRQAEAELGRWEEVAATVPMSDGHRFTMWLAATAISGRRGAFDRFEEWVDDVDIRDLAGPQVIELALVTGDWLRWTGRARRAVDRAGFAVDAAERGTFSGANAAAELAASLAATGASPAEVVAAGGRTGSSPGGPFWPWSVGERVAAVAAAASGEPVEDALLAEVDGWIDRLDWFVGWLHPDAPLGPWTTTSLQRARAERAHVVGAPDPALWDPVVAGLDDRGHVPYAAVARLRRATARAAVDGGTSPGTEADLLAAWGTFTDLELTAPQDDAIALARRLRIALPGLVEDDAEVLPDLTDREREVLALVAEGWTNRKVGEHLFISPRTVSVHMSNAMRKLAVDSRTEAIARAHRAGLVAEA